MSKQNRDSQRHGEAHDDAAYHHETAAYHHRQASQQHTIGNHDEARRHHTMADYHGRKASEHARRALDDVDQTASYGHDGESYDGGRYEEGPRDYDRDAAWRRANEGGRRASFHGREADGYERSSDAWSGYGSPRERDEEWNGGSRDDDADRSNRGGRDSSRSSREPSARAMGWGPRRASDRDVS